MNILIAGDFCPCSRTAELIEQGNDDEMLRSVVPYTRQCDLSMLNFECPIVEHEAMPIIKHGPNLKCSAKALKCIKDSGFNMVTLANNHFYDYGEVGVFDTLSALDSEQILHVGAGKNLAEANQVYYFTRQEETIAIINCCEHEFSIATEHRGGTNPFNPIQQFYAIQDSKKNANYVIVIVHGGHEHYQLPTPRMVETYRFYIDAGADLVVNHHQHCYSGYEVYSGKPIFYGLGNFCFDLNNVNNPGIWNEGYMVKLSLQVGNIQFETIPYTQCGKVPSVQIMGNKQCQHFEVEIERLNALIANKEKLKESHERFMISTMSGFKLALAPYSNRWFRGAFSRGWLPSFLTKKRLLSLKNYLDCESHRERLQNAVDYLLEK